MKTDVFLNTTVSGFTGGKKVPGNKLAIELELEGRGVGLADVATPGWNRKNEASLRGEAIEFTSNGPKAKAELKENVVNLFSKFAANKVRFNDSIRTSTHVHLNFADKPIKEVICFFSLFTLFEEILQYHSGEDRRGNLFCMSSRDAEGIVGILHDAVAKGDLRAFAGDRYKYAACNLCTLYKFGTVEIRTMRGASSAEQVNDWVDILNDMYEFSLKMESPADLIKDLSFIGAEALMKKVFSPRSYERLLKSFPVVATLHNSLLEGARLLQVFAYEFDEDFKAKVEMPKPEEKKKMMQGHEGNRLPVKLDRFNNYAIWTPAGGVWFVTPEFDDHGNEPEFWEDGMRVRDDRRIQWSADLNRFIVRYPNGTLVRCNWKKHHVVPDEGPPVRLMKMPRRDWWVEEEEEADDLPDWEPEFDDEGDEI